MSHYSDFYQDSSQLWIDSNEGSERQQQDEYKSCYQDYEISDLTEENLELTLKEIGTYIEPNIKHSEGKPAGARYCFLEALNDDLIGYKIAEIVNILETKGKIQNYIYQLKEDVLNKGNKLDIVNDLIKLRTQALDSGKYTKEGYKQKIDVSLLLDALARHYIKLLYVGQYDDESGCLHLSHILANLIIIDYQVRTYHE